MNLLVLVGVRILETMFFLGVAGSCVVLLLTTIEDIETLTESDDPVQTQG
jgi:hypothetical protein